MIDRTRSTPRDPNQELLLRELNHRCSNDLQMVIGLLSLQSRRTKSEEARLALTDAMERVAVLARTRSMLQLDEPVTLELALQQICAALQAQAEPRDILISLTVADDCEENLSQKQITNLALVVNELITNAIKHAFKDGKSGRVRVLLQPYDMTSLTILVDDDGAPFGDEGGNQPNGFGLDLVRRLLNAVGGLFIPPANGSKVFELRFPRR